MELYGDISWKQLYKQLASISQCICRWSWVVRSVIIHVLTLASFLINFNKCGDHFTCVFWLSWERMLEMDEVLMKPVGREAAVLGLYTWQTWAGWSGVGESGVMSRRGVIQHSANATSSEVWLQYTVLSSPEGLSEQGIDWSKLGMDVFLCRLSSCATQMTRALWKQWVGGWLGETDEQFCVRSAHSQSPLHPMPLGSPTLMNKREQTNTTHPLTRQPPDPRQLPIRLKVKALLLQAPHPGALNPPPSAPESCLDPQICLGCLFAMMLNYCGGGQTNKEGNLVRA